MYYRSYLGITQVIPLSKAAAYLTPHKLTVGRNHCRP